MATLLDHVKADASNLLPFQAKTLLSRADYTITHGGVGAGKTRACLWNIFLRCLRNPNQNIVLAAKTHRQIDDVLIDPWRQEIPEEYWEYYKGDQNIKVKSLSGGESWLRIRSLDRKDKIEKVVGTTLTGYFLAQAEQLPQEAFDYMEERLRDTSNRELWFRMFDCNASGKTHWIYRHMVDPNSEDYLGRDGVSVESIHVRTIDNPNAYTPEFLEMQKRRLGSKLYALRYEGEWGQSEGKAFDVREGDQIREDMPSGSGRWYLAMDHGFYFACQLIYVAMPYVYVVDEVKMHNAGFLPQSAAVKAMLKRQANRSGAPIELSGFVGDTSGIYPGDGKQLNANKMIGKALDDFFTAERLHGRASSRSLACIKDRGVGWYRTLELLNDWIGERHILTIHPRCNALITCLQEAEWTDDMGDLVWETGYDHPADALRYFCMSKALGGLNEYRNFQEDSETMGTEGE